MPEAKVHRSKGENVTKTFSRIPYNDFAEVLKEDGEAFLEDTENPLKRQTLWKAAKKLSKMIGKTVKYNSAVLELSRENSDKQVQIFSGYLFKVET